MNSKAGPLDRTASAPRPFQKARRYAGANMFAMAALMLVGGGGALAAVLPGPSHSTNIALTFEIRTGTLPSLTIFLRA